jgi:hypothetical protein
MIATSFRAIDGAVTIRAPPSADTTSPRAFTLPFRGRDRPYQPRTTMTGTCADCATALDTELSKRRERATAVAADDYQLAVLGLFDQPVRRPAANQLAPDRHFRKRCCHAETSCASYRFPLISVFWPSCAHHRVHHDVTPGVQRDQRDTASRRLLERPLGRVFRSRRAVDTNHDTI